MSSWLLSVLRTGVQALLGLAVTLLAAHGLDVPLKVQGIVEQAVIVAVVGAVITAVTGVIRWLEAQRGDSVVARAARGLAHILMLGLSGKTPVYVEPDQRLTVIGSDGTQRSPR